MTGLEEGGKDIQRTSYAPERNTFGNSQEQRTSALVGLKMKPTESGTFIIEDPETKIELSFILKGANEAIKMIALLEEIAIKQESCMARKGVFDSCTAASSEDMIFSGIFDISIDDNQWYIGPDIVVATHEDVLKALQGGRRKHLHPLPDGISDFANRIARFVNEVQAKKSEMAAKKLLHPQSSANQMARN